MTSGGLMQLVAYGAQDVYLTANPQVTFFKQLYRRHSNFAMESIEQTFNGQGNFGKRVQCTISRNGDLITKVYVQVTLPAIDSNIVVGDSVVQWVPYLGQYLIDNVVVEIGGQQIDKQYGEWLHIWNELTLPTGKTEAYLNMVNGYAGLPVIVAPDVTCSPCATLDGSFQQQLNNLTTSEWNVDLGLYKNKALLEVFGGFGPMAAPRAKPAVAPRVPGQQQLPVLPYLFGCAPEKTLYIPLEFWFNRHTGLALPLIALQYHEVKINVDFANLNKLVNIYGGSDADNLRTFNNLSNAGMVACSLYVDYIYLDTEERRRFAQVAHEYLIEQLQFTGTESVTSTSNKLQLRFNHPCKELVWVVQNPFFTDCNTPNKIPSLYTDLALENPVAVAKVQLNGQDRFSEREGEYFNYVQPYQHHTSTPAKGINVYSFALRPEDLQPSGSCNFSRIDNAVLNLTLTPATFPPADFETSNSVNVNVYATNYNVLRIMSGMGGLAYSN